FGLDLTDTLARQAEPAADFLERLRLGVGKPVAEDDHMALPVGERCQRLCERFAPQRAFHRLLGERIVVGDEVAENRVLLLADGLFETGRGARSRLDLVSLRDREIRLLGHLLERRLPSELAPEPP